MADRVRAVEYYYSMLADRAGEGAKILSALKAGKINLLAASGFPAGTRSQLDFVPENKAAFLAAAEKAKIKLVGPKTAFLIEGDDRVGAFEAAATKLAAAHINVTAMTGVSAGEGRWGAILWVKPRNVKKAGEVLGLK